jgi:histone deacetylase complex regulatory component SIN3
MNLTEIILVLVMISHITLGVMYSRLQEKNEKLRESNRHIRKHLHTVESQLRFFSTRLKK